MNVLLKHQQQKNTLYCVAGIAIVVSSVAVLAGAIAPRKDYGVLAILVGILTYLLALRCVTLCEDNKQQEQQHHDQRSMSNSDGDTDAFTVSFERQTNGLADDNIHHQHSIKTGDDEQVRGRRQRGLSSSSPILVEQTTYGAQNARDIALREYMSRRAFANAMSVTNNTM